MKKLTTLLLCCIFLLSCSEDESTTLSSEKELIEFTVQQENVRTEIKNKTVFIYFPSSQKEFNLPVNFKVSDKAIFYFIKGDTRYSISNGSNFDLKGEYSIIRVQAEDNSYQDYKLQIIQAEGFQSIRLEIYNTVNNKPSGSPYIVEGEIDDLNKKITFRVPMEYTNDFRRGTLLRTTYIGNKDYITVPTKDEFINFEFFKQLFIIDNNKENKGVRYDVIILNTDAFIKRIELPLQNAFMTSAAAWQSWGIFENYIKDLGRNDLIVFALENEQLTNLKPLNFVTTSNSTFTPDANTPCDFSKDVEYIGTSEGGVRHSIKVRVIKRKVLTKPGIILKSIEGGEKGSIEYTTISPVVGGVLVNYKTKEEYRIESFTNKGNSLYYPKATVATFVMKDKLPIVKDTYYVPHLILENGDKAEVDAIYKAVSK